MPISLRLRFGLWTAALLLLALSAFGAYIYRSMAERLSGAIDESLTLVSAQVVAGLDIVSDRLIFAESFDTEPENLDLRRRGFTVWVRRPGGDLIHAFGPFQDLKLPVAVGGAGHATVIDPRTGDAVRVAALEAYAATGPLAVVQVARSLEETKDTLERLATTLLVGVPGLVAAAGVGGYLLAGRALAPIDRITQTARRISAEDLAARLEPPTITDEVGRLVLTFNQMLARLDEAFRRERQFTADAAHELRTPLSAMHAILDAVRTRRRRPAEYEQALADLSEEAGRLQALTEGLLLLARGEGSAAAWREAVDLGELIPDLCESLRHLARAKSLGLHCGMPAGLMVYGDRDGLVRLFGNLLDNALKFSAQGEVVVTAGEAEDGFVRVRVADTGSGIDPEHLPRIFDRFYRGDQSRASPGAGLGLAIARDIARRHGGEISASSQPGHGTEFTVALPAYHPPD